MTNWIKIDKVIEDEFGNKTYRLYHHKIYNIYVYAEKGTKDLHYWLMEHIHGANELITNKITTIEEVWKVAQRYVEKHDYGNMG